MSKYIDADKLITEIKRQQRRLIILSNTEQVSVRRDCDLQNGVYDNILNFITSLQRECEIVELSFKGGTYRVNGEEHVFKGGKAKAIILEINQEEGNK